jgi:hypothetical protein
MAAASYECADVSSNEPADQMTYYTHHRNMDDPHYVWTHIQSQYSARRKKTEETSV